MKTLARCTVYPEASSPETEEERQALMRAMVVEMKGGQAKGEALKMSRWFSWVEKFKELQRTWTATLVLLKFYHSRILKKDLSELPDPQPHPDGNKANSAKTVKEEIKAMRDAGLNALSLAIPLMAAESRRDGQIIAFVTEPLWANGASRAKD